MDTAIIFDLDGTLLDTLQDIGESCNKVRVERGLSPHPLEAYKLFVGGGSMTLMRRMLPNGTEEKEVASCLHRFKQIYGERWQRKSCLYPEVDAMLQNLVKFGAPLAVLSNKPHDFTLLCIEKFFPKAPFALVFGQREGVPKKPDSTAAVSILEQFGAAPSLSVFVGDSGVDMQTAKSAGMRAVGVSWGFRGAAELREFGADVIIDSPLQLLDYVATLS